MTTDVAGAISGYYKQIYIAIKELLNLKDNSSSVGIECGADIRIFNSNITNESIEVKFYKNNIGLYSPEISKTIYNFYWQTNGDRRLHFNTNTQNPNKVIFKEDKECCYLNEDLAMMYILHLLIKHDINKSKNNNISEYFRSNNIYCERCGHNPCDMCISIFIKKYINIYPMQFNKIIKINSQVDINKFASKISFTFENQSKDESIPIIKKEIKFLLRENYKELTLGLDDIILEAIIHKIAMSLFDSTVFNSIIENPSADYRKHKKISKLDVKDFICNYKIFLEEYKEDVLELKIYDLVEKANLDKEKILFKFKQEFDEYMVSKEKLEVYNTATIKQYFKEIEMKFKTEDERDELVNRFELYNKGFGLIGYLMNLKINEISVKNDKLFLKTEHGNSLMIDNLGYYDFGSISKYINDNKQSEDGFYRYMELEECSFLESISECCVPPFIKIDKLEKKISLEEYQIINNIPLEVIVEIKSLVSSNKNLLIISGANTNRKPFLNAMLSSIPKKHSFFTIAEDLLSLPITCKEKPHVIADSLKKNYNENIKKMAFTSSIYDKCISLIDNYELSDEVIFDHLKLLLEQNKCLIGTLHRDVSRYRERISFEQLCENLSIFSNVDFSIFDSIILLDNYFVKGHKQDVIRIINKSLF
ncbi:hypothetical protein HAU06_07115 [Bacillus toyonensis]|uniref:hypothetical protein n=1 Tax=Bacillus toyonensis TaxID=155322 RepID=UPI00163B1AE2|nr:hypothetical protein [Bacillus toyonensis]MBC2683924.1 hypothetical protein [Bacillus toyonensis]